LYYRGKKDGNEELMAFTLNLEKAVITTIEEGKMTRDLACLVEGVPLMACKRDKYLNTYEFLDAVEENLKKLM